MLLYKSNSRNYASTAVHLAMAWSSVTRCQSVFLGADFSISADMSGQFGTGEKWGCWGLSSLCRDGRRDGVGYHSVSLYARTDAETRQDSTFMNSLVSGARVDLVPGT